MPLAATRNRGAADRRPWRAVIQAALLGVSLISGISTAATPAVAPDYVREQRWADEVVPGLVVGEAVRLETAGKRSFLGLLAEGKPGRGAVLLVHGSGVHPDFSIIGQLRTLFNDAGYTTLSIQMPVLASDAAAENYAALFPEAGERIAAGIAYLRARNHGRIALVSHSMGARMAREFLIAHASAPLAAWVPLAISDGELERLPRTPFPVFDVYAQKDFAVILANQAARAKVLRGIPGSKQAMVFGADHFFAGKEKELDRLLRELLDPVMR